MDTARLDEAANYIVRRNVPATIRAVFLSWSEPEKRLELRFCSIQELSEEDKEWCELALGELVAEVWWSVEKAVSEYSIGYFPAAEDPGSQLIYEQPNYSSKRTAAVRLR